jgi:hypothetical protein
MGVLATLGANVHFAGMPRLLRLGSLINWLTVIICRLQSPEDKEEHIKHTLEVAKKGSLAITPGDKLFRFFIFRVCLGTVKKPDSLFYIDQKYPMVIYLKI